MGWLILGICIFIIICKQKKEEINKTNDKIKEVQKHNDDFIKMNLELSKIRREMNERTEN